MIPLTALHQQALNFYVQPGLVTLALQLSGGIGQPLLPL